MKLAKSAKVKVVVLMIEIFIWSHLFFYICYGLLVLINNLSLINLKIEKIGNIKYAYNLVLRSLL